MGPETLAQVLCPLQDILKRQSNADLLVGLDISDDAAVYKISDQVAIISTVDFFTPVVDDPYHFGAIAAANAMSDVYAMGGEVFLALNICAFPASLSPKVISEILRGGAEKVAEAGGVIGGGHTILDDEPKYGLAVLGKVHPDNVKTKSGAKVGDVLVLTKPLGTGVITTALKMGKAISADVNGAVDSMAALNRDAARILSSVQVSACTDVTGFSIIGHTLELAQKSQARIKLFFDKIPWLTGTKNYGDEDMFPGGCKRNRTFYEKHTDFANSISDREKNILFTPETSGGLLAAVPAETAGSLSGTFQHKHPLFSVVGEVVEGTGVEVLKN